MALGSPSGPSPDRERGATVGSMRVTRRIHAARLSSAAKPGLQKFADRGSRHGPGLSCFLKPILKQDHRGNGGDAEALREAGQLLRIYFNHEPSPGTFRRDFPQFRRDHLARPAPGCPEIDQNGNGGAAGQRIENQIALHVDRL